MSAALSAEQMRELAKLLPTLKTDVAAQDADRHVGEAVKGNIELGNRPVVMHPDGGYSTLYSTSFGENGKEVLVPTVSLDGRMLSVPQAIDAYRRTGRHLGKYDTPEHADAAGAALHNAGAKVSDPIAVKLRQRIAQGQTQGIYQAPMLSDEAMGGTPKANMTTTEDPTAVLTPEQRQAILLHLTGGGDPAHAAAVAQGAVTPAMAQAYAASSPTGQAPLTLAQMQQLAATGPEVGPPDPVQPAAIAPAIAPAEAPATASAMPPVGGTNRVAAQSVVGSLANIGAQLQHQGVDASQSAVPLAANAAVSSVKAADSQREYKTKMDTAAHDVLQKSNEAIANLDQDENDQQVARARAMNDMLGQMIDAGNQAATAAPHDFWADKSTSSRIFGIISQIAGGMANGLANQPGQPTPLDRVIQRDLDQQRLAFAQKSQSGNQASGIYNDLVKATGSTTEAYGALRIAAYKRVLGQMQEVQLQFPELKNNAEFQAEYARAQSTLAQTVKDVGKTLVDQGLDALKLSSSGAVSLANEDTKAQSDKAVARITADAKVAAAKAGKEGDPNDTGDFLGIEAMPGKQAYVKAHPIPKERRAGIETSVTGTENIKREGQELFNLLDNPGGMDERSRSSRIDAKRATILRELTKAFNAGNRPGDVYNAMTAGGTPTNAIEAIRSMLGRDWVPGNEAALRAAIEETINSVEAHTNSQLAHYGRRMAQASQ